MTVKNSSKIQISNVIQITQYKAFINILCIKFSLQPDTLAFIHLKTLQRPVYSKYAHLYTKPYYKTPICHPKPPNPSGLLMEERRSKRIVCSMTIDPKAKFTHTTDMILLFTTECYFYVSSHDYPSTCFNNQLIKQVVVLISWVFQKHRKSS